MRAKLLSSIFILNTLLLVNSIFASDLKNDSLSNYFNTTIKKAWDLSNKKPDSSILITTQALENPNVDNYELEKAKLLRIKGLIYFYKVDFVKSLDYFIRCKELFVKLDSKSGIAAALNSISLIYREQGFKKKSLEMDLNILAMQLKIGDTLDIAGSLNNVAVSYEDLGDYKLALYYYKKAIKYIIKLDNNKSLDLYYNNIGNIYMIEDNLDSALFYFNKSYKISKAKDDKQMICNSLAYYGEYYSKKNNLKKSIYYYEKSLKLAQKICIVYEIADVAEKLHEEYSKIGDYEKAYKTLLIAKTLSDSANNSETMKKLTEIESSSKFDKEIELNQLIQDKKDIQTRLELSKEKQFRNIAIIISITLLVIALILFFYSKNKTKLNHKLTKERNKTLIQKKEIELQRDNIKKLNISKDKFFTIIAHDLKNPISGIYKLADAISKDFELLTKKELKKYIEIINSSTQQAYSLLENLLNWSMMQTDMIKPVPSSFSINNLIAQNIKLLSNNAKQKNITINIVKTEEISVFADKEMILTIIRNILNNSIKFSNNGGNIDIKIEKDKTYCKVSISDNGIGISEKDQKLLFNVNTNTKKIGDSKEKGTGLGLILCKEFIEYNNGKIWIKSELAKYTTFYFTIPLRETV